MSEEDMTIQYLYVMDSNGENRKKAAKLENVKNVLAVLYRDNYVIGAYSNRIELNDEGQIINDDHCKLPLQLLTNHKKLPDM